jgi:ATP phosphoribosyltransferase
MPDAPEAPRTLHLALPKGRMQEGVFRLLADAGIHVQLGVRAYRPVLDLPDFEVKLLKPQNIVEMLDAGTRDVGFAGADWVEEKGADLVELLDTGLDPVRIVAAAPEALLEDGRLPKRHLLVASEYSVLASRWIAERGLDAKLVRTYGATEVFPPEDADFIIDNTATGSTLRANGLAIVDTVMRSSTRMVASRRAMDDPASRARLEDLVLVLRAVLEARARVMIELNVAEDDLEAVVEVLPAMGEPTVSTLHGATGFAVKAAVKRRDLPALIPRLKARGGRDVVVTEPAQIVP